jgi:hypothetical protein
MVVANECACSVKRYSLQSQSKSAYQVNAQSNVAVTCACRIQSTYETSAR